MRLECEYMARQTKRQNRPKKISALTPGDEKNNRKGVSCLSNMVQGGLTVFIPARVNRAPCSPPS